MNHSFNDNKLNMMSSHHLQTRNPRISNTYLDFGEDEKNQMPMHIPRTLKFDSHHNTPSRNFSITNKMAQPSFPQKIKEKIQNSQITRKEVKSFVNQGEDNLGVLKECRKWLQQRERRQFHSTYKKPKTKKKRVIKSQNKNNILKNQRKFTEPNSQKIQRKFGTMSYKDLTQIEGPRVIRGKLNFGSHPNTATKKTKKSTAKKNKNNRKQKSIKRHLFKKIEPNFRKENLKFQKGQIRPKQSKKRIGKAVRYGEFLDTHEERRAIVGNKNRVRNDVKRSHMSMGKFGTIKKVKTKEKKVESSTANLKHLYKNVLAKRQKLNNFKKRSNSEFQNSVKTANILNASQNRLKVQRNMHESTKNLRFFNNPKIPKTVQNLESKEVKNLREEIEKIKNELQETEDQINEMNTRKLADTGTLTTIINIKSDIELYTTLNEKLLKEKQKNVSKLREKYSVKRRRDERLSLEYVDFAGCEKDLYINEQLKKKYRKLNEEAQSKIEEKIKKLEKISKEQMDVEIKLLEMRFVNSAVVKAELKNYLAMKRQEVKSIEKNGYQGIGHSIVNFVRNKG
jgi:hypothetical protein